MSIIRQNDMIPHSVDATVPAAKLHVLGLAPLKKKLGGRWARLSDLVHKLFEKSIAHVQGPDDHFVVLDELSYVVTFGNLSLAQASLMCASIAREVCEHLFGDQIDEISVRSIVAEIVSPSSLDPAHMGAQIEAMLERRGTETVITQSVESGSPKPVTSVAENRQSPMSPPVEQIQKAHSQLAQFGLKTGLFPIWELRRGLSSCLFLTPFSGNASSSIVSGKSSLSTATEAQRIDIEIGQLSAAGAYAARIRGENKICAIGVGVSYDSLCCFRSRIRYITTLQKAIFSPSNPLIIKIEQIPDGAPDGRIAELIAMLNLPNVRVTVEFCSLASIARIGVRLGASGIGGVIPSSLDGLAAAMMAEKLVSCAVAQKAFAFIDRLDTAERVALANQNNIRFGMGIALGARHLTGLEDIPNFPLAFDDWR